MKEASWLVLALTSVTLHAQSDFIIDGKLGGYNPPASVYMYYQLDGENKVDSARVINGIFQFKGTISKPTKAQLYLLPNDGTPTELAYLEIFLEPGEISIQGTDVKTATVAGPRLNEQMQGLRMVLEPVAKKQRDVQLKYGLADSTTRAGKQFDDWYTEAKSEIEKEQKAVLSNFIKKHPDELVSLDALIKLGCFIPEFTELWPLFQVLTNRVKKSEEGMAYATQLERIRKKSVGEMAPIFTMKDARGTDVALTQFRGKYLLLEFWASWCAPCRKDNPRLLKIYDQFKNRNFTILGISLDDRSSVDDWREAIKNDKLPWTQVADLKGWQNEAALLYYVQAIPQNFLIAPDGKILRANLSGDELEKALKKLL